MKVHELSASKLASLMAQKKLSSLEIVDALLAHSRRVDERLGAIVHRFEGARVRARELDNLRARNALLGPLHGLPISVKESIETVGVASTVGLKQRRNNPALHDAATVKVAKEAGALVLFKTNVPQTLLSFETNNPLFGRTKNPYDLTRTPGGSSGGEAAALASGQSVLGIGTDIGGSIRIPATFSGIAGLKPTEHRWSNRGSTAAIVGQESIRSQMGPMARHTEDLALLWQAICPQRLAELDPFVPPIGVKDEAVDLKGMRVGYYEDDGFVAPSPAVRRAVNEAAKYLQDAGAELIPYRPHRPTRTTMLFFAIVSSDGALSLQRALGDEPLIDELSRVRRIARLPRRLRKTLSTVASLLGEDRLSEFLDVLGQKRVDQLWSLVEQRNQIRFAEAENWSERRLDALLCPAFATPAVPHTRSRDFVIGAAYAMRYNVLNLPAGVVPVTSVRSTESLRQGGQDRFDKAAAEIDKGSAGLPVGVQVVARPYQEGLVIKLMQAVEDRAQHADGFPTLPQLP